MHLRKSQSPRSTEPMRWPVQARRPCNRREDISGRRTPLILLVYGWGGQASKLRPTDHESFIGAGPTCGYTPNCPCGLLSAARQAPQQVSASPRSRCDRARYVAASPSRLRGDPRDVSPQVGDSSTRKSGSVSAPGSSRWPSHSSGALLSTGADPPQHGKRPDPWFGLPAV